MSRPITSGGRPDHVRRPVGETTGAPHLSSRAAHLVPLLHELIDAHLDTVELAQEPGGEIRWAAHLDYLRALHRQANEILARSVPPVVPSGESGSGAP